MEQRKPPGFFQNFLIAKFQAQPAGRAAREDRMVIHSSESGATAAGPQRAQVLQKESAFDAALMPAIPRPDTGNGTGRATPRAPRLLPWLKEKLMNKLNRLLVPVVSFVVVLNVAGCKHKITPQPVATAPPAQAPSPTATISASPTAVSAGSPVVLTWHTTNAATATIDGIGDVATAGTKTVTPSYSTNYHLVAHGAGGTAFDDVRVTVTPAVAAARTENPFDAAADFSAHVKDIFFDYDKSAIRTDEDSTLSQDASYLASHPNVKIVIGGYCDERGSDEYNLALGQSRASDTEKALVNDGVSASRIRVISYGKEKPFCTQSTDSCYQKNRRAGFSLDN
jgi:peptidoglycan-associated lipoprotein